MEKGQRRIADSFAFRGSASPWLLHWRTYRAALRRHASFPCCVALSVVVPARKTRLDSRALDRKSRSKAAPVLSPDYRRATRSGGATQKMASLCRSSRPRRGGGTCVNGSTKSENVWLDQISALNGKLKSSTSFPLIFRTSTVNFARAAPPMRRLFARSYVSLTPPTSCPNCRSLKKSSAAIPQRQEL